MNKLVHLTLLLLLATSISFGTRIGVLGQDGEPSVAVGASSGSSAEAKARAQAARHKQNADEAFERGDYKLALNELNKATSFDTPLRDDYLKFMQEVFVMMEMQASLEKAKSRPAVASNGSRVVNAAEAPVMITNSVPPAAASNGSRIVSAAEVPVMIANSANLPVKFELPQDYTDMNGSKFRLIKAGSFMMGSKLSGEEVMKKYPNDGNAGFFNNATSHNVTLTQDFYLCKYPVTRGEFSEFVSATGYKTTAEKEGFAYILGNGDFLISADGASWKNPGFAQTDAHPVVCVSYEDALAYIEWLNNKSQVDDKLGGSKPIYRLPTEAEWEYSCRAGTTGEFFWGDDEQDGKGYLNGADTTKNPVGKDWDYHFSFSDGYSATSPVGSFKANPWGLYDMLGNVWEWTSDRYGDYPVGNATDPTGASTGSYRVLRGGCWGCNPASCRCANRRNGAPSNRDAGLGFRVAFSLTSK